MSEKVLYNPTKETEFVSGEGIYLYDSEGNSYVDCSAGTFNLCLGNSNKEIIQAAFDQANKMVHVSSSYKNSAITKLAEKLIEVSPPELSRVHLKPCGGSTANELAIKMAMNYTGKSEVISLFKSHHGQTFSTTQISGLAFRKEPFRQNSYGSLLVPGPECHRCFYGQEVGSCQMMCVSRIEDFMNFASNGNVAAIIMEPILGNGDNIVPPTGYHQAMRKFCDDHGIVLIFDEVQTGIGRTGHMFGSQYFGVTPDILTLSKGLGAGFPMAAILCREKFVGLGTEHVSFTFGGNLVSAAASLRALEIIQEPAFLENVTQNGEYIRKRLNSFQEKFSFVDHVRGVGLMIGFEIVDSEGQEDVGLTNKIVKKAFEHKLLLRTSRYGRGNVIKVRPALNITLEESKKICDLLETTLNEF